jgi:eukaryotic-like serine/threonine-protein kinase
MNAKEPPSRPEDPAEAAFDEFFDAWNKGETLDAEEFCNRHPECKEDLQNLIEQFLFVSGGLHTSKGTGEQKPQNGSGNDETFSGRTLGDFRIIREIGSGGMGTVYEAEQISLKRRVALKLLPSHLSILAHAVLRFRREAVAGGKPTHPGIVAVYAVGEHKGTHYIAQELVEGGFTLADKLDELRRQADQRFGYFREVAMLIARVADALQHAHESGVIHRDVKPSNILLTGDGNPKVTDFGLAKVEDALKLSRTGDFAGTPYYMSPEQAASKRIGIDHRTDVFSLGVTLYEILTFELPFDGETSQEVIKKILLQDPRDPRKANPKVPRDLGVICLKAMEKEPDRRYAAMEDFAEDLRRFLSGDVILARLPGVIIRLKKLIVRHPALSAAAGVALLSLAVLVCYVMWSYPQIFKERNEARRQHRAVLIAKAETEKEAEKSSAISRFIIDMLTSANPRIASRDVKVADVLDGAVEEIGRSFTGLPEVEAALRHAIGDTYHSLGLLDDAEKQLTAALEIRRRVLGDDHTDTLESMGSLATVLPDKEKAESFFRKVLGAQRRVLGEEHISTLNTMHNLALALTEKEKRDEAEALFRDVLEAKKRVLGEEHFETAATMGALALLLCEKGNLPEAESLHRAALNIQSTGLGPEHPDSLAARTSLGIVLNKQGKYVEAEALFTGVLEVKNRVLGEEHPGTLITKDLLAFVFQNTGRFAEAESLHREIVQIRNRLQGEDDPCTLDSIRGLAIALSSQGKYSDAEPLFRKIKEAGLRVLGEDNWRTRASMHLLGETLYRLRKYGEAEDIFRESLDTHRRVLGEDHLDTLATKTHLAFSIADRGGLEEALSLLREVLEARRRLQGDEHELSLHGRVNLALLLERQNRYSEAESLYREVLEIRLRVLGEEHTRTLTSTISVATMLAKQGKFSEAEPLYRQAFELARKILPQGHPLMKLSFANYGECLFDLKRYDEAEEHLLRGYEMFKTTLGEKHKSTQTAIEFLILLYDALDKPDKADEYRALLSSKES